MKKARLYFVAATCISSFSVLGVSGDSFLFGQEATVTETKLDPILRYPRTGGHRRDVNTQLTAFLVFARIDRATGSRASDGDALDRKRFRCT